MEAQEELLNDNAKEHWLKITNKMINKAKYRFAHQTLKNIKSTIVKSGKMTKDKLQAIKNIRWS